MHGPTLWQWSEQPSVQATERHSVLGDAWVKEAKYPTRSLAAMNRPPGSFGLKVGLTGIGKS